MQFLTFSMARHRALLLLAAVGLAIVALASPLAASAHENREVGEFTITVGFIDEPAIQGDTNGIWVRVMQGEEPVTGLADTLTAQAIYGDQTRDFTLVPAFGDDGVYEAVFIPTEPGDYTFRFFGQVEGVEVDETFTSSPEGFDSVAPRAELEFPSAKGSTGTVAMPLAAGAVVLVAGAAAYAVRRRYA